MINKLSEKRWPESCLLIGSAVSEFCLCILLWQSRISDLHLTAQRIITDVILGPIFLGGVVNKLPDWIFRARTERSYHTSR